MHSQGIMKQNTAQKNSVSQLINSQSFNSKGISEAIQESLKRRISAVENYDIDETRDVAKYPHTLFPEGFEIEREISDELRQLCATNRLQNNEKSITSHRKYIGPVIVFFKKAIWKFFDSQLSQKFAKIEEFNTHLIVSQINSAIRFQELKKKSSL